MRTVALLCSFAAVAWGQAPPKPAKPKAPFSQHLIPVQEYSQAENEAIVTKFKGLRTTYCHSNAWLIQCSLLVEEKNRSAVGPDRTDDLIVKRL